MRPLHAFKNAMRTRRTHRIDLDEADRLAAGDPPGATAAGLGTLLDSLRAPGTRRELAAEKDVVAAFTAQRKRAARSARRNRRTRIGHARRTPARTLMVPLMTALALLLFGGTALAARTGNLPAGAQQHAHRLFSALGVPAPRTGPHHPSPTPSATPAPTAIELGWCADWQPGGPSLSSANHEKLTAAAGSEQRIPGYCDTLRRSAAPSSPPPSPSDSPSASPSPSPSVSISSESPPTSPPSSKPTPKDQTHTGVRPNAPPR